MRLCLPAVLTLAAAFCLAGAPRAQAFSQEDAWSIDPRQSSSLALPAWIRPLPQEREGSSFARASFEITPLAEKDLLLTVCFDEVPGGFLRVFWSGSSDSEMLSDNLYEDIGMSNQRSLLIPRSVLSGKGVLTLQSSQSELLVSKIHLQWLESRTVSAAGSGLDTAVLTSNSKALPEEEVNGYPFVPKSDDWKALFITAPLTEKAERIEEGVEFQAELESAPSLVRLEALFSGLPLDGGLTVWVNGRALTAVALETPDFSDPGYQKNADGPWTYIGWRRLQVWLPHEWLQQGVNKFQFSWPGDVQMFPVAVKDLSLQLGFSMDSAAEPPLSAPVAESQPVPDGFQDLPPLPLP